MKHGSSPHRRTRSRQAPSSSASMECPLPRYLTLAQLSALTTLSQTTLKRLFKRGRIPGYQPGGPRTRILFPHDAIEQAGKVEKTPLHHQTGKLSGPTPRWKRTTN